MTGLRWSWIAIQATAPMAAGVFAAWLLWRVRQLVLGSLAGAVVLFGSAIGLMLKEYVEIDRMTQECLELGYTCWPEPSPFMRYAVYGLVGLLQVILLFYGGLRFDEWRRQREYAPEWRR